MSPDPDVVFPVLAEFDAWMLKHRGVRPSTLRSYRYPLQRLVRALGGEPSAFSVAGLRGFVCSEAKRHSHSYARRVASSSRMFLRFLSAHGRCDPALVDAIPAVAGWRLAQLPRYLRPEVVERAIAVCDAATAGGLRDRALLMLSSRLGLRAEDLRALQLDDLDFDRAVLRVGGKSRSETLLPLPQDVGDALLAFLDRARPACRSRHVFVRCRPPAGPLKTSRSISGFIRLSLRRAGVVLSRCGAHTLRHSAAFRMLEEGASLETIGAVLRHASVDTTAIYAKVDLSSLRDICQPWPGEVRP